jgi:hypothetical protein
MPSSSAPQEDNNKGQEPAPTSDNKDLRKPWLNPGPPAGPFLWERSSYFPETVVTSIELWASAKFIGRECATANKEYVMCKKEKGMNPTACLELGDRAVDCANKV